MAMKMLLLFCFPLSALDPIGPHVMRFRFPAFLFLSSFRDRCSRKLNSTIPWLSNILSFSLRLDL